MTTQTKIEFTRINNDVNGNPRYVCHFYNLLTAAETAFKPKAPYFYKNSINWINFESNEIEIRYKLACKRANKIGGRKYHTKSYGGGIVFQSYNIADTERKINELLNS